MGKEAGGSWACRVREGWELQFSSSGGERPAEKKVAFEH